MIVGSGPAHTYTVVPYTGYTLYSVPYTEYQTDTEITPPLKQPEYKTIITDKGPDSGKVKEMLYL